MKAITEHEECAECEELMTEVIKELRTAVLEALNEDSILTEFGMNSGEHAATIRL